MSELQLSGLGEIPAILDLNPHPSWQIEPPIVDLALLHFICPNPVHSHSVMIRVHKGPVITEPMNAKNVWHYEDAGEGLIAVSASILLFSDFHTSARTIFRLVSTIEELFRLKKETM